MQMSSKIQTGKVFTFNFDELPEASKYAIIEYGSKRWINDKVNSIKKAKGIKEVDDINKLGEDVLNRLLTGNVTITRSTSDARLPVVLDFLAGKKVKDKAGNVITLTKAKLREAIKEQGINKFIEAAGGEAKVQAEMERRAKAEEEVAPTVDLDIDF